MIDRGCKLIGLMAISSLAIVGASRISAQAPKPPAAPAQPAGWTLPPDADTLKSPVAADEKVIAAGRAIFKDKCSRCHGPGGLGDGPDADPDAMDMDLTVKARAERNPDGVVFHKVLSGKRRPKMPAFNEELSQDQIWAVVAYAQSLRKK